MSQEPSSLRGSVGRYCAELGMDPLLVQGAGGNVSWKDGDTLWVKASGAWLADAATREIFVPVDLAALRESIGNGEFSATPKLLSESTLKPSIETILHALMPQTVVVHLHAVDVLACLVRTTLMDDLVKRMGDAVAWVVVDYHKPGAELAAAIYQALQARPDANLVFMKNHGLVIGGPDVDAIRICLESVTERLCGKYVDTAVSTLPVSAHESYIALPDPSVQQLALVNAYFQRLGDNWALYPDHVVFLGPMAHVYASWDDLKRACSSAVALPELVFVRDSGVFVLQGFSQAKAAQLRCYYDVIVRQAPDALLNAMNPEQIAEVLNWDSEKYRQCLEK